MVFWPIALIMIVKFLVAYSLLICGFLFFFGPGNGFQTATNVLLLLLLLVPLGVLVVIRFSFL